jgi:hypothetical protein
VDTPATTISKLAMSVTAGAAPGSVSGSTMPLACRAIRCGASGWNRIVSAAFPHAGYRLQQAPQVGIGKDPHDRVIVRYVTGNPLPRLRIRLRENPDV